jgi:hypothetical protein
MRDGFLATMVAQFKKSQSRSSAVPPGFSSRPPSTVSSTPIPPQEVNLNNHEQSNSERSTPSHQRPASVLQQSKTTSLIAKCQSCNIRGELIVCIHCDNVICIKCADEHQSVINKDVKREWDICKTKFENIHEQSSKSLSWRFLFVYWILFISVQFDHNEEEVNNKARNLQTFITKQSVQLIQTVENHKNAYIDMIENHRRTYKQS